MLCKHSSDEVEPVPVDAGRESHGSALLTLQPVCQMMYTVNIVLLRIVYIVLCFIVQSRPS